jgi:hypothetical protein
MPSYAAAFAHEKITVSTTAIELDDDKYLATTESVGGRVGAKEALITVEDAPIRFTLDGTTPVDGTDTGHVLPSASSITVYGLANIRQFRAVRSGGTDAVINVTYFRS